MKVLHISASQAVAILNWFDEYEGRISPSEWETAAEMADLIGMKGRAHDYRALAQSQSDIDALGEWEPEPEPAPEPTIKPERYRTIEVNVRNRTLKFI